MKIKSFFIAVVICTCFTTAIFGETGPAEELAGKVVSDDPAVAVSAIAGLRGMGSSGLDALFLKYSPEIERFTKTGVADGNWNRIAAALEGVAQQKDAFSAHLYWHTDLEAAKRDGSMRTSLKHRIRINGLAFIRPTFTPRWMATA